MRVTEQRRHEPKRRKTGDGYQANWLALTMLVCIAFGGQACAATPAKASSPPSVKQAKGGPSRSLAFRHSARPEFTGLEPGSYVFEVAGESYGATTHFRLPSNEELRVGNSEWKAAFTGDELGLLASAESVTGLIVPARLTTVNVRVRLNGSVIFDGAVTRATSCSDSEPVPAPDRLCIFMDEEFGEPAR